VSDRGTSRCGLGDVDQPLRTTTTSAAAKAWTLFVGRRHAMRRTTASVAVCL